MLTGQQVWFFKCGTAKQGKIVGESKGKYVVLIKGGRIEGIPRNELFEAKPMPAKVGQEVWFIRNHEIRRGTFVDRVKDFDNKVLGFAIRSIVDDCFYTLQEEDMFATKTKARCFLKEVAREMVQENETKVKYLNIETRKYQMLL